MKPTPLFRAAANGHAEICRMLIEYGNADVSRIHGYSFDPDSPIFAAVRRDSLETVRAIAQASRTTPARRLALQKCIQRDMFVEKYFMNALMLACFRSKTGEMVKCLLEECGADPNCKSRRGTTVLMAAAQRNNAAAVSLLLEHGSHVDAVHPDDGRTALHHAAVGGSKKAAELLLNAGANIAAMDKDRCTALNVARAQKSNAVVSLLESWLRE